MIAISLGEIADAVGGRVRPEDAAVLVTGPATLDSREAGPGSLFVAVAGDRADGHDFAAGAVERGAAGVLASRETGLPAVLVDDVEAALGRLARHVLGRAPQVTVLALTGSQGKTGTKDLLAAVLEAAGPTVATQGNLNNEWGVPLTVLRVEESTRYLVVEMGARGIGHIGYLCSVAPPDVAAVLNVGTAHVGEFGSREAIAAAKGEIMEALDVGGTAVLHADDPLVAAMAGRTAARVVTFGARGPHAPTLAYSEVAEDADGRPSATLSWYDESARVRLRGLGRHQVLNAAAAAAMALAAGVPFDLVTVALETAESRSRWRMERHERGDGLVVVNDAYNANPASMVAALDALAAIRPGASGRRIAVLGAMFELGASAAEGHHEVGAHAAAAGVDVLVVVAQEGHPEVAALAAGAREAADPVPVVVDTAGRDDALSWLRENVGAHDVVLVKASRGVALEQVADGLLDQTTGEVDER